MTIDIKQLESLLERVTPGPWEVSYLDENGQSVVKAEHTEVATCWHHCVGSIEKQMHANAHLIAAAPELARRVIAAEKLAEAVRAYRAKPETHIEEHVRTGLSYPEINVARMERSIRLANAVDEALSEWENMK